MGKVAFKGSAKENAQSAVEVTPEQAATENQERAIQVVPSQALEVGDNYVSNNEVEGEVDSRDRLTPRLQIVGKSGTLADTFTPGSFVLNKDVELVNKDTPLTVIPVKVTKYYQEHVEFGSENLPRRFSTAREVADAGGSTDPNEYNKPGFYGPAADIVFLVQSPKNASDAVESLFPFEIEGLEGRWLMAQYSAAKTAYGKTAMPIITVQQNRKSIRGLKYTLGVELKKKDANSWFSPVLRPAGTAPASVTEFLAGIGA